MKTLLQKLQEEGQFLQAACNGRKTCGLCKVKIFNAPDSSKEEQKILTKQELTAGIRLACCQTYHADMRYTIPLKTMQIVEEIETNKPKNRIIDTGYGMIVDIGTTTIVMKWISLKTGDCMQTEAFQNPQVSFGGDVITRIKYDTNHPHVLHEILIMTMQLYLLKHQQYTIKKMLVCGNTTMTHIFLDIDVTSLGHAPFHVPKKEMQIVESTTLFKEISLSFPIITFPHIGAYVGGDIVSGIIANTMDLQEEIQMLLDLGTNGEIAVGNAKEIVCTSTAAGPAFEGLGITNGGPSIAGAITKVTILDTDEVTYETIFDAPPNSICGSGLISLLAQLRRHHIINDMGRFNGDIKQFHITKDIYITESDIQIFQLAKAAIQAGIYTLLKEKPEITSIYIAGGFASKIEVDDLIVLKMIPSEYRKKVKNVKNSALHGVYDILLTEDYERLTHITEISRNINLAEYADFEDMLLDGLYF